MEQTLEKNITRLLNVVKGVVDKYEAEYQKTGEKFNLFKVARITEDEVKICQVLAELLNPKGKHGMQWQYLNNFWEIVSEKFKKPIALDMNATQIRTEYMTDKGRRIDIVIEDGSVFVPIEVKIGADDQPDQVADYAVFVRKKNDKNGKDKNIPMLYLTKDGHKSKSAKKDDYYVCLSFNDDILQWLKKCEEEASEKPVVRNNIKQLIGAVESFCGIEEDSEMELEVLEKLLSSVETLKVAQVIAKVIDKKNKNDLLLKVLRPKVHKLWKGDEYSEDDDGYAKSIKDGIMVYINCWKHTYPLAVAIGVTVKKAEKHGGSAAFKNILAKFPQYLDTNKISKSSGDGWFWIGCHIQNEKLVGTYDSMAKELAGILADVEKEVRKLVNA